MSRLFSTYENMNGEGNVMEPGDALKTVKALADGINPMTGEVFPLNSPYQNPDVVRALFCSIRLLEREVWRLTKSKKNAGAARNIRKPVNAGNPVNSGNPVNAGKPWTPDEEKLLADAYTGGTSLAQLAGIHKRSVVACEERLVRLGLREPRRMQLAEAPQ